MRSNDYSRDASLRRRRAQRSSRRRGAAGLLALALAGALAAGGTVAWLSASTPAVTNTFDPGKVPNVPVEEFDGETKESIAVKNEGNVDAYVRVKLATYRVDDGGDRIGGAAEVPAFAPAGGWFEHGGCWYYPAALAPGETTPNLLPPGGIELEEYGDADGGKQVIEVISESIQSLPADAVELAWGVGVGTDGRLTEKTTA